MLNGIKLSPMGASAWLYAFWMSEDIEWVELPKSLCKVFWCNVAAILIIILTLPVFLITRIFEPTRGTSFGALPAVGLSLIIGMIIGAISLAINSTQEFINVLIFLLCMATFYGVMIGSILGISKLASMYVAYKQSKWNAEEWAKFHEKERIKKLKKAEKRRKEELRKSKKSKSREYFDLAFDSFINNYCPKIDWNDD